ncbi:hypothetical protein [Rosistilla carotiformis]|nr:hypothetical protein [Rosistilla carotiformis]
MKGSDWLPFTSPKRERGILTELCWDGSPTIFGLTNLLLGIAAGS